MTQSSPRTNFNSSRLIRLLADLSVADPAESKRSLAERLGQWLDFADAIALHAAHDAASSAVAPAARSAVRPAGGADALAVDDDFAQRRAALVDSITTSCSPGAGETRIKWPVQKTGAALEPVVAYEPYRRFYLAHQGEMESIVRPLRSRVRHALAKACPALKRLAVLDESFDKILSGRERQVLATLPALLETRFAQRLAAHQQRLVETGQTDDPAVSMMAGGWLAGFCQDVQAVLLAELELRLQPTVGLIEALRNEANTQQ